VHRGHPDRKFERAESGRPSSRRRRQFQKNSLSVDLLPSSWYVLESIESIESTVHAVSTHSLARSSCRPAVRQAVFKLSDVAVLVPSAFVTAYLAAQLSLGTRALVGLKSYIPVPGGNDAKNDTSNSTKQMKKSTPTSAAASAKKEDMLASSQVLVYPLSLTTRPYPILKMPEVANLESLTYSALLMVIVSSAYGLAVTTGVVPVYSTAALLLSASVLLMSMVAMMVTTLLNQTSTAEDRVYALLYSCVGFFVAVAFFASEPKGLFTWSPAGAATAAASLLTAVVNSALGRTEHGENAANGEYDRFEIEPPMSLLGILFAIVAACITAVLHASILRFTRAFHAHMNPPKWMKMYMDRAVLDSRRLQLQMVAPMALVLLYVQVVVGGGDKADELELELVAMRSAALIATGLLFLVNTRIVVSRYLEIPLVSWYQKKHENVAGKSTAERAAAWAVVSTLADVVATTAGKAAMMAVAPGVMYLSCGVLTAGAGAYAATKGGDNDVGRYTASFVENSVGFVVTFVGGMWMVVAGMSLWLLRTGTVRN